MKTTEIKKFVDISLEQIHKHPFIIEANGKKISKDKIVRWIMCAGRESRTFPEIIKNMISWLDNQNVKNILIENLNDEYGNGNPEDAHFRHYLQLIEKIGLTENDFINYNEKEGIKLATSLAYNISMLKNPAIVLGYMLVNEEITPISYLAVKASILVYYPDLKTDFFDIHIEIDEGHVAELYKALEELDSSLYEDVLFGIRLGQRGMEILFDEAYGIFNQCTTVPVFTIDFNNEYN